MYGNSSRDGKSIPMLPLRNDEGTLYVVSLGAMVH